MVHANRARQRPKVYHIPGPCVVLPRAALCFYYAASVKLPLIAEVSDSGLIGTRSNVPKNPFDISVFQAKPSI